MVKISIQIDLTVNLCKNGFKWLEVVKHDAKEAFCQECGHLIKYEFIVQDLKTSEIYSMGRICFLKLFAIGYWGNSIKEADLEDKNVIKSAKVMWIIKRDFIDSNFSFSEEIPHPRDYNNDFELLLKDLKDLLSILKKRYNQIQKKRNIVEAIGINFDLLNQVETEFVLKCDKLLNAGYKLSPKQVLWLTNLKSRKCVKKSSEILNEDIIAPILSKWDSLSDWEKGFIESISDKINSGNSLSEKQVNKVRDITKKLEDFDDNYDEYVGKVVNSWIIEKKTGMKSYAYIIAVKRNDSNSKAILCDYVAIENGEKVLHGEQWIPKSQITNELVKY